MKLFNKLFMMALVLSVFAGCGKDKDDEPLPKETYKGTIIVEVTVGEGIAAMVIADTLENVPVTVEYSADKKSAKLSIPGEAVLLEQPITATCTVTSTADTYSFSGSTSVSVPIGASTVAAIINISNSTIDKTGHAVFNMTGTGTGVSFIIGFDGQKQ